MLSSATIGLAFAAGVLSTLSPCVLPLLPIVIGSAAAEHRLAPVALAAGLALSFTVVGLFVATIGFALGLDAGLFRNVGAVLLLALGVVLIFPVLQERITVAAGPFGAMIGNRFGDASRTGIKGQFGVGLLLGAVWSPCAGPTLGAASVLASQGQQLVSVALTMLAFGIGAALPLLIIGALSREAAMSLRSKLMTAGRAVRTGMGGILMLLGLAIITGADKSIETYMVTHSPEWLTRLTTSL